MYNCIVIKYYLRYFCPIKGTSQHCRNCETILKKVVLDIQEIKETLKTLSKKSEDLNMDEINSKLPLKNLHELEDMENFIVESNKNKNKMVNIL